MRIERRLRQPRWLIVAVPAGSLVFAFLASGIAEALNCTAFGIATSLVGLLGFSLLQGKTTSVTDDINEVTVQVVNLVTTHRAQMQPTG